MECLTCGYCTSMPEDRLQNHGLAPGASLVTLTKRLACSRCGGKVARTVRMADNVSPPLIPEG